MSAQASTAATVAVRIVASGYALLTVAWLARGLVSGRSPSYPADEIVLDYLFSSAMLVLAATLLRRSARRWGHRLLGLGLVGAAGAYNVQAGLVNHDVAPVGAVLLHGCGTAAVVMGLLLVASGASRRFGASAAVVAGCAGLAGWLLAGYAPSLDFLLAFGVLTPLAGSLRLPGQPASSPGEADRQARLVRKVSASLAVLTVLIVAAACITRGLGTPGLLGDVPGVSTADPQPWRYPPGLAWLGPQVSAFWVSRVVSVAAFATVAAGLVRLRPSDVGRVAGRAMLYATLIALVGGAYVIGVVRIDASFGLDSDWLAPPQVAAAGLVALVFQPVRALLERVVDRVLYGRRLTSRQMVAQVTAIARASSGGTEALRSLAALATRTLGTEYAAVYVTMPDGEEFSCVWPEQAGTYSTEWRIPVHHHGCAVGALAVPAARRTLPRSRRRLVADLSRAAGVIIHNTTTSFDLIRRRESAVARSAEIRASRWRIVAAQDCERRDLERALHDVAQPGLTAVRLALGLINHLASNGNRADYQAALLRLRGQIELADAGLRQTLRGIDPPALTTSGIVAALREISDALGAKAEFVIGSDVDQIRFDKTVEAATFYCCSEALHNCVKHSPDATIRVSLDLDADGRLLRFAVSDNGSGFDPAAFGPSSGGGGLQNMADRLAAVSGELVIDSAPGSGTRVSGTIPVRGETPSSQSL